VPNLPPIQCTGALYAGVKRQGPEAYNATPTSVEIKKSEAIRSLPPYVFIALEKLNFLLFITHASNSN
jgi:hypothetical protein